MPVLQGLLKGTGSYSNEEQELQIKSFREHVLPTFGPRPPSEDSQYLFMSHNGSPIELSINLSDAKPPLVRFSFEPIGRPDTVAQAVGADMRWFEQLAAEYFPTDKIAAAAKLQLPPNIPRVPSCLAALDLQGDHSAMKAYFGPMIKAVATGVPGNAGAIESIKNLRPCGEGMAPALELIEQFHEERGDDVPLITMIGIDCIDPTAARVKMYTRIGSNAFNNVRDVVTLGGRRVDDVTMEGLKVLRQVWPILLNEPEEGYDEDSLKREQHPASMHSGIMVTWELQSGKAVPEAKVYIPLFQFFNSNREITAALEKVFEKRGWAWGYNGGYRAAIEGAL